MYIKSPLISNCSITNYRLKEKIRIPIAELIGQSSKKLVQFISDIKKHFPKIAHLLIFMQKDQKRKPPERLFTKRQIRIL